LCIPQVPALSLASFSGAFYILPVFDSLQHVNTRGWCRRPGNEVISPACICTMRQTWLCSF